MTLTIDLTPIEERRITAAASQKGLDTAEFIKRLLAQHLSDEETNGAADSTNANLDKIGIDKTHFYFTATRAEFNDALNEIAAMNTNLPVLIDAAFDRESLYEERF